MTKERVDSTEFAAIKRETDIRIDSFCKEMKYQVLKVLDLEVISLRKKLQDHFVYQSRTLLKHT